MTASLCGDIGIFLREEGGHPYKSAGKSIKEARMVGHGFIPLGALIAAVVQIGTSYNN